MSSKLALLGGKPAGGIKPPQFPVFDKKAIEQVSRMLERGETVGLGRTNQVIADAEQAISDFHGGRYAMCVSSGHSALMSALMGLGLEPGDEVITTPYTWGASISCMLHLGLIPVFVDIIPETGLIDPDKIEGAVSDKTKAVLVVHLYGQPCNMKKVRRVAKKHGLKVIEDGSQAHGATFQGEYVGSFSDAAAFSCMGGKLLATAEAGYMVTPHEDVFWRTAMMGQHYGRSAEEGFPEAYKPYVDSLVFTFRLSPIIASLLPSQLRKLPGQVENRRRNVAVLREELADCRCVSLPVYADSEEPAFHILTLNFHQECAGVSRDTFKAALAAEGVNMGAYVPLPINKWKRLQWQGYEGPRPFWLKYLEAAGTDYAAVELPNCEYRVGNSLEMGWNFYKPAVASMRKLARAFRKIEDNIESLRDYEQQTLSEQSDEASVIDAAKRAASAYRRKKG